MSDRDERPSPDPLVAGASDEGLLRKLRSPSQLLQKPLHPVRSEAAQAHAKASAYLLSDIASLHPGPSRDIKPSPIALRLLTPLVGQPRSDRVLTRLAEIEAAEPDVWLRDDLRIAWLCVVHAAESKAPRISFKKAKNYTPELHGAWDYAFWRYLGQVPEKLIPLFVARAQHHAAMEGLEQNAARRVATGPVPLALPPKKSPHRVSARRKAGAR